MSKTVKRGKNYICNCEECGRMHIWNKPTAESYNMKYTCRECGHENEINEVDYK